jgi:hypothetical protein
MIEHSNKKSFNYQSVYNAQTKAKSELFGQPSSDAQNLATMFERLEQTYSGLKYYIDRDQSNSQLKNFLLITPDMFLRYQAFGQCVLVDTTFGTNRFRMPLLVILGVDNENRNCLFGLALLEDEKEETFNKIFGKFNSLMGHVPEVIISDQGASLIKSIAKEFPSSQHFLCNWHIQQNLKKHFTGLLQKKLGKLPQMLFF